MSFHIQCPHCGSTLKVTEKAFGQELPCPACKQMVSIPQPATPAAVPSASDPPPVTSPRAVLPGAPPSRAPSRLPPGMPPLPPGMPRIPTGPDVLAAGNDVSSVAARYRASLTRRRGGIIERLRQAAQAGKKRARAIKLAHEVKGLQTALDTQLESLGNLTLTHQPPTVDIGDQIVELSRIQEELAHKGATLESLGAVRGSGPVVKELKREVEELVERQRATVLSIGRSAAAVRPEMPGAAGSYAGLDRLQSSLDAKQGEVRSLEVEFGSLSEAARGARFTLMRPVLTVASAGGGLALLCVLWLLVSRTVFGTGVPNWAQCYVPNDAAAVGYFNIDAIRRTNVFRRLQDALPSGAQGTFSPALRLSIDDIRDSVVFVREGGETIEIVRAHEDLPLAKVVSQRGAFEPQKCRGFEYTRTGSHYCAKTDVATYCSARSEEAMLTTLKQLDRKEPLKLNKELQRAVEAVGDSDLYFALASYASATWCSPGPFVTPLPRPLTPRLKRAMERADWVGVRLSIDSSVTFEAIIGFRKQDDAEDYKEATEAYYQDSDKLESTLAELPSDVRKMAGRIIRESYDAASVTRKGCMVHIRIDLKTADVEEIIDEARRSELATTK